MALIQKLVKNEPTRKNFYVLDVGAGNFQWGDYLADVMEDVLQDREVILHIISVRGEKNLKNPIIHGKRCKVYKLGAFEIENISREMQSRVGVGNNKFDLIISHWCLRHLADPVGTFVQLYNLVRPHGVFLFDGFFYETKTLKIKPEKLEDVHMINLLFNSEAPFLVKTHNENYSINQFIVQKPDHRPCSLPMQYLSYTKTGFDNRYLQIGSNTICKFKCDRRPVVKKAMNQLRDRFTLAGDFNLYCYLKNNKILPKGFDYEFRWEPILKKEKQIIWTKITTAIAQADHSSLGKLLDIGFEIQVHYEPKCRSFAAEPTVSPLGLAVRQGNLQAAQMLIKAGVGVNAYSDLSKSTALHDAIEYDREGNFVKLLIDSKAYLTSKNRDEETPLALARKRSNFKAIELLQDADPLYHFVKMQHSCAIM